MPVVQCPPWEYKNVQNHEAILQARTKQLMGAIFDAQSSAIVRLLKETRRVHAGYFRGLTPPNFDYYAGNYRGSDFPCLRDRIVGIASDRRVGHSPGIVERSMYEFASEVQDTIDEIDFLFRISPDTMSDAEKLVRCSQLLAALFVYFLEIHPYVNGNGHMGRLIVIAGLKRQGYYASRWPLHPRPQDPPYSTLIAAYRSGNRKDLEDFLLACL
jgi:Fic/DOC family